MAGFDGLGLFPVEIDVYKKHKVSTINAHEDDANGRGLLVTLLKDGVPFNTTGIDLKLAFRNSIGEERLFAFSTVDLTNGKYSVTYPREMLEGNGGRVVRVEIKAYDTATQAMISYSPLNVYVSEAVVTEGQLVTNSQGSEFVQLLERVETVETGLGNLDPVHIANVVTLSENAVPAEAGRVSAEAGRVSAESSRVSAESGRVSAESARATAESDRASAESSRVSAENARVLSENARASSEDARVLSESARVSAESTRATAEGTRVNAESNRQNAESARVVAESSRVNAESARSSNEAERILHEDDRVADEALRASAETTRVSNETARGTAETSRVNAESARTTAESSRVTAETGRNNAESSRVSAEQGRVTAEQTRASFYAGFNAQLAEIAAGEGLNDRAITPEKSSFFVAGKNMINHAKAAEGYYINQLNGILTANPVHASSDYIEVEANQKYVFSGGYFQGNGLRHAFYDSNKVFISGANTYTPTVVLTAPANAKYIRISTTTVAQFYTTQMEKGEISTPFESFNIKIPESFLRLDKSAEFANFNPKSVIFSESFKGSTLPDDFNNVGFTLSDGALSPASGGFDKELRYTVESTIDKCASRVWVTPNASGIDFAIAKKSWYASGLAGLYRYDGVNNKLIMYAPWQQNLASFPAIAIEKTLTMPIVVGRKYLFEVIRNTVRYSTFRVTDTITGESEEITNDYVTSRKFSIGHGYTGIIPFSGNFKVNKMELSSREPLKPRVAIYGDSFIEASTLILDGGLDKRYASLLSTKLNGNIHINGRGGEASAQLVNKISADFNTVKADYTVLAIGTNDSDFSTWLGNVQTIIDLVESRGSIPVLLTLTKMTAYDRTAFMTAVNNWIINSGYKYVDANLVTTLNNDRLTQNTSLFMADGVHPNMLGHEVIYKRFLVDVPEIFDGY